MKLKIVSYNSTNINDGSNYNAFLTDDMPLQGGSRIINVDISDRRPKFAKKVLKGIELEIIINMLGTVSSQIDTLKALFDVEDQTERKFICKDVDNSDKQWYVYATTKEMPKLVGSAVRVVLAIADPVWYEESQSSDSWSITDTGQTKEITVGGNVDARPLLEITPTSTGGHGYAYRRLAIWYNPTAESLINYPLQVCGAVLDTATLISGGKMQADGDDLRVYVNGLEVNRWLYDINTANTKVWISLDFQPGQSLTLRANIADDATEITFKNSRANRRALNRLPDKGEMYIGTELINYSQLDVKKRTISNCERGLKGTTAAAHSEGDTAYWIEHEIWVYYGNASAEAPDTDDTKKPIISLASTNTSWVYEEFADNDGLRAGVWSPSVVRTSNTVDLDHKTDFYTGNQTALADPATEMGMSIYAFQSGSSWKAEKGRVVWTLYHPAFITHITASGEKWRKTTYWPVARFYKSTDGKSWSYVWIDATPSSAESWEALAAHSSVSLGDNIDHVMFLFSGSMPASEDNAAHYAIEDVTLTLNSSNVPQQAAFVAEGGCYFLQSTVTNNTSGEWLEVITSMPLNTKLTVDCEEKEAYLEDGTDVWNIRFSSVRKDWLNVSPGTNELQFDDEGTAGVTVGIYWRDRNS